MNNNEKLSPKALIDAIQRSGPLSDVTGGNPETAAVVAFAEWQQDEGIDAKQLHGYSYGLLGRLADYGLKVVFNEHKDDRTFVLEWVRELHPIGPKGKPHSRLLGHVRILGADFHVNAEQVKGDHPVLTENETYVPELLEITDGQPPETVSINGRHYLLMITPFAK